MKSNIFAKRFLKFAVVGVIASAIHILFLYMFTEFLSIYYLISSFFAFIIANIINFILNKSWTFEEKIIHKTLNKYVFFLFFSTIALVINLLFLYIFSELFGVYYIISQILAIGISLWINFLGNMFWTFKN